MFVFTPSAQGNGWITAKLCERATEVLDMLSTRLVGCVR